MSILDMFRVKGKLLRKYEKACQGSDADINAFFDTLSEQQFEQLGREIVASLTDEIEQQYITKFRKEREERQRTLGFSGN